MFIRFLRMTKMYVRDTHTDAPFSFALSRGALHTAKCIDLSRVTVVTGSCEISFPLVKVSLGSRRRGKLGYCVKLQVQACNNKHRVIMVQIQSPKRNVYQACT